MPLDLSSEIEVLLRLSGAMAAGMLIGLNRNLRGKALGVRTLGLVSLGSALGVLAAGGFGDLEGRYDAVSRAIQGILTGVGFLGAGVILHEGHRVRGLTTAASAWVAAAFGIAAGLGAYAITVGALVLALILLVIGGPIERLAERFLRHPQPPEQAEADRRE